MSALLLSLVLAGSSAGLAETASAHGIEAVIPSADFVHKARGYEVSGGKPDSDSLVKYARLWIAEWNLYPEGLMKKAKVKKVVFAEKLRVGEQFRAAVPAFDLDSMYYDPAYGAGRGIYQRSVVHHEFFHMMDQRMGILYTDPEWAALNSSDFRYGSGGAKMREPGVGNLTKEIPGFLTRYGTAGVEEDKAELFAHLIVSSDFVAERAQNDSVLASKIVLLKKRLSGFHSGFNEEFWKRATVLDRSVN